jgi:tetratricopeptide (TPR) repeat protein
VQLSDYNVAAHHGCGAMLMFFGHYGEAAEEFREVIARRNHLRPIVRARYFEDTDLLGRCLMACGRPEEAARAFRAATRLDPPPANAAAHLRAAEARLAESGKTAPPGPVLTDTQAEASKGPMDGD